MRRAPIVSGVVSAFRLSRNGNLPHGVAARKFCTLGAMNLSGEMPCSDSGQIGVVPGLSDDIRVARVCTASKIYPAMFGSGSRINFGLEKEVMRRLCGMGLRTEHYVGVRGSIVVGRCLYLGGPETGLARGSRYMVFGVLLTPLR